MVRGLAPAGARPGPTGSAGASAPKHLAHLPILVSSLLSNCVMKKTTNKAFVFFLCTASVLLFMRCGGCQDNFTGEIPDGGGVLDDGGTSPIDLYGVNLDAGVIIKTDGGTKVCYYATCQGKLYSCGDCIDNDGDGRTDSDDPDCLGPCDNTESGALTLGIPGGNNAPCKADCYFDQDTGTGNDSCFWDHSCDPFEVAPNYYPEASLGNKCAYANDPNLGVGGGLTCSTAQQTQSNTCKSICGPLVPNACDCFGCCTIGPQADAANKKGIWLGSLDKTTGAPSCTLNNLADPNKCHPCTIVSSCYRACGPCQFCLGDPPTKVFPPTCYQSVPDMGGTPAPDGGVTNCPAFLCTDPGRQACSPTGSGFDCAPCPAGTYCQTGCCQPVIG